LPGIDTTTNPDVPISCASRLIVGTRPPPVNALSNTAVHTPWVPITSSRVIPPIATGREVAELVPQGTVDLGDVHCPV
jgi:hypothetical protein